MTLKHSLSGVARQGESEDSCHHATVTPDTHRKEQLGHSQGPCKVLAHRLSSISGDENNNHLRLKHDMKGVG